MSNWLKRLELCVLALIIAYFFSWLNAKPVLSENGDRIMQSLQESSNWELNNGVSIVEERTRKWWLHGGTSIVNDNLMIDTSLFTCNVFIFDQSRRGWKRLLDQITEADRYIINKEACRILQQLQEKADKTLMDRLPKKAKKCSEITFP
jgi:hypothetical protein